MKKILMPLILLILGLGVGGGAAYGVAALFPAGGLSGHAKEADPEIGPGRFVRAPQLLAPIVTGDGRLSGYARFTVMFEVSESDAAEIGANMPLFLHEMNLVMWKTPLASGQGRLLPDTDAFANIAQEAAAKAFEQHIRRAVIVDVNPV